MSASNEKWRARGAADAGMEAVRSCEAESRGWALACGCAGVGAERRLDDDASLVGSARARPGLAVRLGGRARLSSRRSPKNGMSAWGRADDATVKVMARGAGGGGKMGGESFGVEEAIDWCDVSMEMVSLIWVEGGVRRVVVGMARVCTGGSVGETEVLRRKVVLSFFIILTGWVAWLAGVRAACLLGWWGGWPWL